MAETFLPSDVGAERSVIGAVLVSPREWHGVAALVQAEDFYVKENAAIYRAMMAVDAGGTVPDLVAVTAELRRTKVEVDPLYVRDVTAETPTPASATHYARIVARMAAQRRLIGAAGDVIAAASVDGADPDDLVARAIDRFQSAHWRGTGDMLSAHDVQVQALDEIALEEETADKAYVPTGIGKLDGVLGGGLKAGRFYIVAARPSVGKSALVGNIVLRALRSGVSTLFVSLEMTGREVLQRLAIDAFDVDPANESAIIAAMMRDEIAEWPLHFRERADLAGMVASVRDNHYGLVVLDYVQLLPTRMRFENRQLEVAHIARSMKLLAMDSRVPVIAAAQLGRRKDEGKKSSVPRLSDLRESGAQEQDADVVILLDRDSEAGEPETRLIVAKNRHGRTGGVDLTFDDGRTRFRERLSYSPTGVQHPAAV